MLLSLAITGLLLSFSVPVASAQDKPFESLSVGQSLPHDRWDDFGGYPTETLPGNGSTHWIGYIPKADVSFAYDRAKRIVVYVGDGKTAQDWFRDAVAGPGPSTKQSPIGLVSASLGDNKLQIRAADLRSVPNPKGQGVFVYVPKTRFRGVERYILWMVIDGEAYSMNGATKNVTPQLVWPREAPASTWRKTALDKYTVTEAIKIVFNPENAGVGGRTPEPVQASQQKEGSFPGSSPTCGSIVGKTRTDLRNVKIFCKQVVPEEGIVVGAYSMQSLLWIKLSYEAANVMRRDPLVTEQLVKNWMAVWKLVCESEVVTIYVEWKDVEIARGETTAFSGDKVTLRK